MKRFAMRCAVVSALGVAIVAFSSGINAANNLADPDIKTVMQKVNGKGGLKGDIDAALKAKEPKWDDLATKTKELVPLAAAIPKDSPPKGTADSWKKYSEAYAKAAVDLDKAVADKDSKAATAAFKVITTCGGCHGAIRASKWLSVVRCQLSVVSCKSSIWQLTSHNGQPKWQRTTDNGQGQPRQPFRIRRAVPGGRCRSMVFDYFASGAGAEITLRANRSDFDHIRLRPHALVGVSERDHSTMVFGQKIPSPIAVAPMAFQKLAHADGEIATVRGCWSGRSALVASTMSTVSMEEIAAAATGPIWFQLYVFKDRGLTKLLVERAEAAGFTALQVTGDVPVMGLRESDMRNAFHLPPEFTIKNVEEAGFGTLPPGDAEMGHALYTRCRFDADLSWKDIEWLCSLTKLPVLVKGILRGDDAVKALDHGVKGIVVSNHGGRQLDTAVSAIEALPEVVEAVAGTSRGRPRQRRPPGHRCVEGHRLGGESRSTRQAGNLGPGVRRPSRRHASSFHAARRIRQRNGPMRLPERAGDFARFDSTIDPNQPIARVAATRSLRSGARLRRPRSAPKTPRRGYTGRWASDTRPFCAKRSSHSAVRLLS